MLSVLPHPCRLSPIGGVIRCHTEQSPLSPRTLSLCYVPSSLRLENVRTWITAALFLDLSHLYAPIRCSLRMSFSITSASASLFSLDCHFTHLSAYLLVNLFESNHARSSFVVIDKFLGFPHPGATIRTVVFDRLPNHSSWFSVS